MRVSYAVWLTAAVAVLLSSSTLAALEDFVFNDPADDTEHSNAVNLRKEILAMHENTDDEMEFLTIDLLLKEYFPPEVEERIRQEFLLALPIQIGNRMNGEIYFQEHAEAKSRLQEYFCALSSHMQEYMFGNEMGCDGSSNIGQFYRLIGM